MKPQGSRLEASPAYQNDDTLPDLADQRANIECSPASLVTIFAVQRLRALRPAQFDSDCEGRNFPHLDRLDQVDEALAPQAGNDVIDGVASRIQGYIGTDIVTLNCPLSGFALLWSPRTRTYAAVLAERLTGIVSHWRRDELELRLVSAGFFIGTMADTREIFSAEIKVTNNNYFDWPGARQLAIAQ